MYRHFSSISIYQGRMLHVFLGMRIPGPSPPALDNQPALSAGNPRTGIAGSKTNQKTSQLLYVLEESL